MGDASGKPNNREFSELSAPPQAIESPHPDPAANREAGRPLLADRYDVLTSDGRLVFRVDRAQAEQAILAGVAEGVGRTCVKYLRISRSSNAVSLNAGSQTTRRPRNEKGEFIGCPLLREHRAENRNSPRCQSR